MAGPNIPSAKHVIHVVVPDSIITHYNDNIAAAAGNDHDTENDDANILHLRLALLRKSYTSVLECAVNLNEANKTGISVAIPALGCGINGWNHRVSAKVAGEALAEFVKIKNDIESRQLLHNSDSGNDNLLKHVNFVLKSKSVGDIWEEELSDFNFDLNFKLNTTKSQ